MYENWWFDEKRCAYAPHKHSTPESSLSFLTFTTHWFMGVTVIFYQHRFQKFCAHYSFGYVSGRPNEILLVDIKSTKQRVLSVSRGVMRARRPFTQYSDQNASRRRHTQTRRRHYISFWSLVWPMSHSHRCDWFKLNPVRNKKFDSIRSEQSKQLCLSLSSHTHHITHGANFSLHAVWTWYDVKRAPCLRQKDSFSIGYRRAITMLWCDGYIMLMRFFLGFWMNSLTRRVYTVTKQIWPHTHHSAPASPTCTEILNIKGWSWSNKETIKTGSILYTQPTKEANKQTKERRRKKAENILGRRLYFRFSFWLWQQGAAEKKKRERHYTIILYTF